MDIVDKDDLATEIADEYKKKLEVKENVKEN